MKNSASKKGWSLPKTRIICDRGDNEIVYNTEMKKYSIVVENI